MDTETKEVAIPPTEEVTNKELNVYPILRHVFLIFCILLTVLIVFFLMYQNGKSIYENGI
jgi:hypothetical protein